MPSLWNNVDELMQKNPREKRGARKKACVSYSVAAEVVISNSVEPTFTGTN
jgi:hypothetical protein